MKILDHEADRALMPPTDEAREIARLEEALAAERDRSLRHQADHANYRRRMEHEREKRIDEGKRAIISSLLEIVDDVERALKSVPDEMHPLTSGVVNIHRKCLALLAQNGVQAVECLGRPFDPDHHEAVAVTAETHGAPGVVVGEVRRGYMLHDVLLRPAQVRVTE